MKILIIQRAEQTSLDNENYRPLRTATMCDALSSLGHEITWITSTFNHSLKKQRFRKQTEFFDKTIQTKIIFLFGSKYASNIGLGRIFHDFRLALSLSLFFIKNKKKLNPDIVICSIPSIELALITFITFFKKYKVLDIRDLWPDVFKDLVPKKYKLFFNGLSILLNSLNRICFNFSDCTLGLTNSFLEWGSEKIIKKNHKKKFLLLRMSYPKLIRKFLKVKKSKVIESLNLTFVGTLGKTNDLDTVIQAINMLPNSIDVKLNICGAGLNLENLKSLSYKKSIKFHGWQNKHYINDLLEKADIGIAPYINSKNYTYNMPNKIAELLAHGLPVALSLNEGETYNFISKYECGFSYENSAEKLRDKIIFFYKNKDLLIKYSNNSIEAFKSNLSHDIFKSKINDFCIMANEEINKKSIKYSPSLTSKIAKIYIKFIKLLPNKQYNLLYENSYTKYKLLKRVKYKLVSSFKAIFLDKEYREMSKIVRSYLPYTMGGAKALENAFEAVSIISRNSIPGDIIECGVAKGGCSAALIDSCRYFKIYDDRHFWLFDSYEGLPETTKEDYVDGKAGEFIRPLPKGSCLGTLDEVKNLMFNNLNTPEQKISFIKGWFDKTVPETKSKIKKISILRLDGDWYESTKIPLEAFFSKVEIGGVIIIDDYGTCYGSKKALDEFIFKNKIKCELLADGRGGAWFIKES